MLTNFPVSQFIKKASTKLVSFSRRDPRRDAFRVPADGRISCKKGRHVARAWHGRVFERREFLFVFSGYPLVTPPFRFLLPFARIFLAAPFGCPNRQFAWTAHWQLVIWSFCHCSWIRHRYPLWKRSEAPLF